MPINPLLSFSMSGKINFQTRFDGFPRTLASLVSPAAALVFAFSVVSSAQNASTTVTVATTQNQHPISPNIYGAAFFDSSANVKQFNLPTNRIGGNNTSTYNWNIQSNAPSGVSLPAGDAMNLDNDWFFESYLKSAAAGGYNDGIISASAKAAIGTQTIVTIPMLPYVATVAPNANTSAASLWSFSIKKYGAQVTNPCSNGQTNNGVDAADPYQPDAGFGIKSVTQNSGGSCTLTYVQNNPADAYVPNSPAIQKAYVQYLVNKYGDSAHGGIKYYMLDNEPSLWSSTHRDVHPNSESYDEIWNNIQQYAGAIKSVDPNAIVIGPEEWDWWAMWESGKDQANGTGSGSDYATHSNTYYYPWLLQQLAAYKQANGINLIDVLSVHCYTDNGSVSPAVNTRELWDPNYHDPNWWQDIGLNGGVPDWIPLMQKWIQQYDPGLQTGCTEYSNWDSDSTIGGIATQADMLGIFGYYGLDFANTFTGPYNGSTLVPSFLAFLIYRNYDGNLSTFGDISVSTTVADPDDLSAFSALRESDGALTVMVVNKQTGNTPVAINLPDFANMGAAQVFQVNSASQTSVSPMSAATITNNAITATLPGPSVTLFVVPAASGSSQAAATPTFTPPAGSYTSAQSVTISDSTANAIVYYTSNGTAPTTSSTQYSGPVSVRSSETLKAIAVASGYSQSAVASATYTINIPPPATPNFSISGTAVSLKAGSTSGGSSTITVTPSGGFTGVVVLSAAITTAPSGATHQPTLSFGSTSPVSIAGTSAGTATLTVSTVASSSNAFLTPNPYDRWSGGAGTVLACLLLFAMPITWRKGRVLLGATVLLMILTVGVSGCGGRISVGGGNANSGTTAGTYIVTVTGTSGTLTNTGTVTVVVQ